MEIVYLLLAAILPAVLIAIYICRKDKVQPEPRKWLLKAFGYGVLSAVLAILIGLLIPQIQVCGIASAFAGAFVNAAIPEESVKLLCLWLLLRKNPYYDEQFDGIVYSGCVGLGFATFENILYLCSNYNEWLAVGINRAIFAVPGHFFFAVLMGYYLSLYHFGIQRNLKTKIMIWLAPVLAHGLYDGILFAEAPANALLGISFSVVFFYFFYRLAKLAKQNISLLVGK